MRGARLRLCRRERCAYYGVVRHPGTGRTCYYEPGCVLGWVDVWVELIRVYVENRMWR
jgi:hypothetical protein